MSVWSHLHLSFSNSGEPPWLTLFFSVFQSSPRSSRPAHPRALLAPPSRAPGPSPRLASLQLLAASSRPRRCLMRSGAAPCGPISARPGAAGPHGLEPPSDWPAGRG
jgi:hypothetical protein